MRLSISSARETLTWAALVAGASACFFGAASCSETNANPPTDAGPLGASGGFVPEIACTDTRDSIYDGGDSVFQDSLDGAAGAPLDPSRRGDIVRCEQENDIALGDLQQQSSQDGHVGRDFVSGAFEYRVLYRTWRGTGGPDSSAPTIGVSSAVVFVPDHPAAHKLPTIVISRGTSGQGGVCTPTATDPVGEDIRLMAYPLVGAGYVVIAPDLAGYAEYGAQGNPPSGYAAAVDVGQSTIDGARALKKMFAHSVTGDTVLVGHSQGGHTTLSALALADSYAKNPDGSADVNIAGVVVYAPLWLSQRSWGALFFEADQYSIASQPLVNAISIWYHYTNGELMAAGHGLDVFKPEKQEGVKKFVDDDCNTDNAPDLQALGTTVKDIFTQDFQDQITLPAALG
ncbi:MAG: alpha/beta fold hydrolase, partial [Polyangiaceae bacterium]